MTPRGRSFHITRWRMVPTSPWDRAWWRSLRFTPPAIRQGASLLVNDHYLLTGDTLFVSSIGRPDLGDKAEEWAQLLYRTLFDRIARLPDDVLILPAHYSDVTEMRPDGIVATTSGRHGEESGI